jgi:hypothetical protein
LSRSSFILAVALLLAQIGALAHAYSHLQTAGGAPDRTALHSSLCGDCATFGAVLTPGGYTAASIALPIAHLIDPVDELASSPITNAARHFFQAQGPPTLR